MSNINQKEMFAAELLIALKDVVLKLESLAEHCDRTLEATRKKLEEFEELEQDIEDVS